METIRNYLIRKIWYQEVSNIFEIGWKGGFLEMAVFQIFNDLFPFSILFPYFPVKNYEYVSCTIDKVLLLRTTGEEPGRHSLIDNNLIITETK